MYEALVNESVRCAKQLKSKKCRPEQCKDCPVGQRVERLMDSLNDWEQLEVSHRARVKLADSENLDRSVRAGDNFMKWVIALMACFSLFCIRNCIVYAESAYGNRAVLRVLSLTEANVRDLDGNGRVNCIDYAVTFKLEWDKVMPKDECEIVRNYNPGKTKRTSMNHLFVRVWISGEWVCIEPQTRSGRESYLMEDYWGTVKYVASRNVYGETDRWMLWCRLGRNTQQQRRPGYY